MDKLERYREIIKEIIRAHDLIKPSHGDIEQYVIFDEEGDRYLWISTGWHEPYRMYGSLLHMDIKNGKIWIHYDGTEDGVANELLERGVPKEDIVLAFHAPSMRELTGFALG